MESKIKSLFKNKRKIGITVFALLMACVMGISLLSNGTNVAALEKESVSDSTTLSNWSTYVHQDTENVGRIWTDKSVIADDSTTIPNPDEGGQDVVITKKDSNSDFLVGLSALSSASSLLTTTTTPLDIVLVLDTSGSMDDALTYEEVYGNNINQGTTYYIYRNSSYVELTYWYTDDQGTRHYGFYDENSQWTGVEPKESTNDNDSSHVQFYQGVGESKMEALKSAANQFAETAATLNASLPEDNRHRISLVKFAANESNNIGNDLDSNNYNYSQIVTQLQSYTEDDVGELENAINSLQSAGGTRADYGLSQASRSFSLDPRDDSNKIVIFFTDGNPTSRTLWEESVAANTVNNAKLLKDNGVTVYSIGVIGGANPSDTSSNINKYLNAVSSNYKDAVVTQSSTNNYSWDLGDRESQNSNYYFAASSATELNEIFQHISQEISSGTGSPTRVTNDATTDGYITFVDTLGDYMEVSDMNSVVFAGQTFNYINQPTTDGATTTYHYEGSVAGTGSIYPDGNLSDLRVSVTKQEGGKGDIVQVQIPASLIPLRYFDVEEEDGTLAGNIQEAYPIRIFYEVSLKDSVETSLLNGTTDATLTSYISNNTEDGKAYFYSNAYTKGSATGSTTATFTPSTSNGFYYFTENTPLYLDQACTQPATNFVGGTTYYYQKTGYDFSNGVVQKQFSYPVTPPATGYEDNVEIINGQVNVKAGVRKNNRTNDFIATKAENNSNTATQAFQPSWVDNNVQVALGNNGRIALSLPGTLSVSKEVVTAEGFDEVPESIDQDFNYTLTLKNNDNSVIANTTYTCKVYNTDDSDKTKIEGSIETITTNDQGVANFTLKDGQTLDIFGLTDGVQYTIKENLNEAQAKVFKSSVSDETGYVDADTVSGTIAANTIVSENYRNTYSAESTTLNDNSLFLKASKVFTNGNNLSDTEFDFVLSAGSGQPMPEGSTVDGTTQNSEIIKQVKKDEEVDFGNITFTQPGTYTYSIFERTPAQGVLGITYSDALYTVTVRVTDDNGKLTINNTQSNDENDGFIIEKTDDDAGITVNQIIDDQTTPVITNRFSVTEVNAGPLGVKVYNDPTGQNPLRAGMFSYKVKPLSDDAPHPQVTTLEDGSFVVTNAEDGSIVFGQATFGTSNVNQTYEYEISEIIPDDTKGIVYDTHVYKAIFSVTTEQISGQVYTKVDISYQVKDDQNSTYENYVGNRIRFTNSYTPSAAVVSSIHGEKNLIGRTFVDGDAFDFVLSTDDQTTIDAMNDGSITYKDETAITDPLSITSSANIVVGESTADFNFDADLQFKKVGTYRFKINEVQPNSTIPGITYDTSTKEVIVVVSSNNDTGRLVANVSYNNGSSSTVTDKAVFTNAYSSVGSVSISATKVLNGRPNNTWLASDMFTFTLTAADDPTRAAVESGKVELPNPNSIQVNSTKQTDTFNTPITIRDAGVDGVEYKFVITEMKPSNPIAGVEYADPIEFTVRAVDEDNDGKLILTTSLDNNTAVFTNTYVPTEATLTSDSLTVTKNFTGRENDAWLNTDSFDFTIGAADDFTKAAFENDEVYFEGDKTIDSQTISIDSNTNNHQNSFSSLKFTKVGTYTFNVKESASNIPGVTSSNPEQRIVVNVTDNNQGQLSASIGLGSSSLTFYNTYQATGTATLNGTKTLTGREFKTGDSFSFNIQATNNAPLPSNVDRSGNITITPDSGTTSEINFGEITFNEAGQYEYVITENELNDKGVVSSEQQYTVVYEVSDNQDGTLNITRRVNNETDTNIEFNNVYTSSSVDLNDVITVQKSINGRDWQDGDEYTFDLSIVGKFDGSQIVDIDEDDLAINESEITVSNSDKTSFGDITFNKSGTYVFNVKENSGKISGITYSKAEYQITVKVTDDLEGNLVVGSKTITQIKNDGGESISTPATIANFVNTYSFGTVTLNGEELTGSKILTGRDSLDGETFNFTLSAGNKDTDDAIQNDSVVLANNQTSVSELKDGSSKKFNFGDIQFTMVGTYVFNVNEALPQGVSVDNPTINGTTYDTHTGTITVEVSDVKEGVHTGELSATVTVSNTEFTNTYSASSVTNAPVGITKKLDGKDLKAGEFEFNMSVEADDEANNDGFILPANTTVTNAEDGSVTFDAITFTKAGTYTVTVKEVKGDQPFITYDDHSYTYKVRVIDNTTTGQLEANVVEGSEQGSKTFTNTYKPDDNTKEVNKDGKTNIDGQMVGVGDELTYTVNWVNDAIDETTGKATTADVTITDVVPQGTQLVEGSISDGGQLTENGITWTISSADPGAKGTVSFKVKVTEDAVNVDKVTNTASVTVGDNNPKQTNAVENSIPKKTIEGLQDDGSIQVGDILTYTISYANTKDEVADIVIKDTLSDGLTFVEASDKGSAEGNEVTWTIKNVEPGTAGTVTVKAKVNEKALSVSVDNKATIKVGNDSEISTNTLTNETKTSTLTISKNIVLTEGQGTEIDANKEFEFTVILKDTSGDELTNSYSYGQGESIKSGDTIKLKHDQSITINGLPVGTQYEIQEKKADGYVADEANKTGSVDEDGTSVLFTNTYDAQASTGVPADFTLTKVLEGKDWTDEDNFTFTLTGNDGAPMPESNTVTVGKPDKGNTQEFNFGEIEYTQAGTYTYTVTEMKGDNAGISYSGNTATITVNVTDNGEGQLVASATVNNGTFTNVYSSELDYNAKGGFSVIKKLTNQDLSDGQFTFTINAGDDASAQKAGMKSNAETFTNTASSMDVNGLSTSTMNPFKDMKFTEADSGKTYSYTISETSEESQGYTNDKTVYTIEITSQDDGKGGLVVTTHITGTNGTDTTYTYEQSKTKEAVESAQIVFDNKYEASTTSETAANFTGTKTLNNLPLAGNDFTFNVMDKAGNVVISTTNDAYGNISFGPINYTKTQLIQDVANGIATQNGNTYTYVYTVSESATDSSITTVTGSFTVTVEVTDNGDGILSTNVQLPDTGLAFINTYGSSAEADISMKGSKVLNTLSGNKAPNIAGKYTFTITGSEGTPMPTVTETTNDAAGNVDFGTIHYTMQNVFGDDGQQIVDSEETEENVVEGEAEQQEAVFAPRQKTFTYTISESGNVEGITNDSESKVVNVTVTDNGDGTIGVSSDSPDNRFTFTNTYSVVPTDKTSPTDSAVTIKKSLTGREMSAEEFSFEMKDNDGNVVSTGTNDENGNVLLAGISFDNVGDYEYIISEVDNAKGGITYDSNTYKAVASVTDNGNGTLKVEWKVTDLQGEEISTIEFNNEYKVSPNSLTIGGSKMLTGRDIQEGEFNFELKEDGEVISTAANDENGAFKFDTITYDKVGTYTYTVTEQKGSLEGITYDESVYEIKVEVIDDNNGSLMIRTTTTKDDDIAAIVFKNVYEKPVEDTTGSQEDPKGTDGTDTATRTFGGLFTSLMIDAATLSAILVVLKKKQQA